MTQLDQTKSEIGQMKASERSMMQAYFMVWSWASEAVKAKRPRVS